MTALQPAFVTPLVECDPRLIQYLRASFSHEYTAARTETVNYGNGRGFGVIAGNRLEFDYLPPSYMQHNSSAVDGLGDTSTLVKYRIASGNAGHGSFDVAALLNHSFATGTYKNGAATDTWGPVSYTHLDVYKRQVEAFNVFNHAQFFGPARVEGNISSTTFGEAVSAMPPRLAQIALRYRF